MAEKTFNQEFEGYWREENKSSIPSKSGIYCVYECTHNIEKKNITIQKLIYIGESGDVNDRVSKHEKIEDWKKHVRSGNKLCYSFSFVDSNDRERVEAAFIFRHKPPENSEHVDHFHYDKTIVKSGPKDNIALLADYFVANYKE